MTAITSNSIWSFLGPMRVPFLLLPPVCVFLGYGAAVWRTGDASRLYSILALIGGLSAHICVNALNEYSDFKSGLDLKQTVRPSAVAVELYPLNLTKQDRRFGPGGLPSFSLR